MQNSELYRRGIVLPLDQEAEDALRVNDVDSRTFVRYLQIPDQETYDRLWKLKLFHKFGDQCGIFPNDYEEDWIEASMVKDVLRVVKSVSKSTQEPILVAFLNDLESLIVHAVSLQRPLLFVL